MDKPCDELSKSLAEGVSRREALRKFGLTLAGLIVLAILTASRGEAQTYAITDMHPVNTGGIPYGINATGQVTGPSGGNILGFLWTPANPNGTVGSFTSLPPLPGPSTAYEIDTLGFGVNGWGEVAGLTNVITDKVDRYGNDHFTYSNTATIWQNGIPTALKTAKGANSFAWGINDSGDVVGFIDGTAALWHNGSPAKLATPGKDTSAARAINNLGQIVGTTVTGWLSLMSNGSIFGFALGYATLWQNGSAFNLGVLPVYNQSSFSNAINSSGKIAGGASAVVNGVFVDHAFLWTPATPNGTSGRMVDLGTLPGSGLESSAAYGINASGVVVGACYTNQTGGPSDSPGVPFIWDSVHGMRDINTLIPANSGWALLTANAINDGGQIVGWGVSPGGYNSGFLLTPQ